MPIRKPYKKNSRRFRKGNGKPKHRRSRRHSFPPLCSQSNLDFAECELAILRQAVDENEKVIEKCRQSIKDNKLYAETILVNARTGK